jgi:hypothetical protein
MTAPSTENSFLQVNGFGFITNLIDIKFELPLSLLPEHIFRKADSNEIRQVKEYLAKTDYFGGFKDIYGIPYELLKIPSGNSFQFQRLPENEWKYYVITFENGNKTISDLQSAALLLEKEISFDLAFMKNGGRIWRPHALFNQLSDVNFVISDPLEMEQVDFLKIVALHTEIINLDPQYSDIMRAIQMFDSLRNLGPSNLMVLGLFAIIESLVTHKPKPSDTGDSLTRQVKSKMPLLSRRAEAPIKYSNFFTQGNEDTIWTKLYEYRSNLAHGGTSDFSGKLSVLKNADNVIHFLRHTTKTLLRHALKEPRLVIDLREC